MLLLLLLLSWRTEVVPVAAAQRVVKGFLYQSTALLQSTASSKATPKAKSQPPLSIQHRVKKKVTSLSPINGRIGSQQAAWKQKSDGIKERREEHTRLVQLLHDAIQQHALYPANITDFARERTVVVKFILSPTGVPDQITIAASCGNASIDAAALASVAAINPFHRAAQFLTAPSDFTVSVLFQH